MTPGCNEVVCGVAPVGLCPLAIGAYAGPWGNPYQLLISVILINMSAASMYRRCDKRVQASSNIIWWVLVLIPASAYIGDYTHQSVCLTEALRTRSLQAVLHDFNSSGGVIRHPEELRLEIKNASQTT